jgi:type I restriction enzyme S subunit
VCAGDLVFNNVFAWEGAVAVASEVETATIGSHRFVTYTIKDDRADPRFLQLFFRTESGRDILRRVSPGSAGRNRTLNLKRFAEQQLHLPSLPEQLRIVTKVKEIEAKVDEASGLREHVQRSSNILWKVTACSAIRALPEEHWRALSDVVEISGGGTPSKDNPAFWNGTIPWISPKDMKQREIDRSEDYITEAGLNGSSATLKSPGVVLIVIRGMILIHTFPSAVLRVSATINQDMKALSPRPGLLPEYLCVVLWALNDDILEMVDRSGHDTRKLVTPKLQAFRIPVPTLSEQRRIVTYLDDLQAKVDSLKALQTQSSAELDALVPSILDKAFKRGL